MADVRRETYFSNQVIQIIGLFFDKDAERAGMNL